MKQLPYSEERKDATKHPSRTDLGRVGIGLVEQTKHLLNERLGLSVPYDHFFSHGYNPGPYGAEEHHDPRLSLYNI